LSIGSLVVVFSFSILFISCLVSLLPDMKTSYTGYQISQEGIFVKDEKASLYTNLKPAAAKPLPQNQDNQSDKDD